MKKNTSRGVRGTKDITRLPQKKPKKARKSKRLLPIFVIGGIMSALLAFNLVRSNVKYHSLAQEKEQVDQELHQAQVDQVDLEEYIRLLEEDEYILQIARSEYMLSKDGEVIFNLLGEEGNQSTSSKIRDQVTDNYDSNENTDEE